MSEERTHNATTSDGITLRGTVHGQGPPLVFWHGAFGDGDLDWRPLLPYLSANFTCYLPSWRGRGTSDEHPDLSYGRRVDDVLSYVDSIGEPAGLVGWSGSASPALAAAARSDAIAALAVYEPTIGVVMTDQERAAFGAAIARMQELAAAGRPAEALRAMAGSPFNDEEIALVDATGYFDAAARYVDNLLEVFRQLAQGGRPAADDPAVLRTISAPVLALHGSDAKAPWVRGAQFVVEHVPDARLQVIPAAGHAAPLTHPDPLAGALADFFSHALPR